MVRKNCTKPDTFKIKKRDNIKKIESKNDKKPKQNKDQKNGKKREHEKYVRLVTYHGSSEALRRYSVDEIC